MNVKKLRRKIALLKLLIMRSGNERAEYIRKNKLFYHMGVNNYFHPWKIPYEGYLVNIHNNVYVAANVTFLTHDVMDGMFNTREKMSGGDCPKTRMSFHQN